MDVRACKKCGTLFNFSGGLPLCPTCVKEIDDKFPDVKQYIYDHPKASVQEVSQENEIPIAVIKKWVKEERLTFSEGSAIAVECERCGKMILSGRYCESCKKDVANQFSSRVAPPKPAEQPKKPESTGAKMRFLK